MRRAVLCLSFLLALASAAHAQSVGLSKLETDDLQLLYYDPIQTYLTPYVARAYENSFAFQEKMFGWKSFDRPTLVLRDLSDYGQAIVSEAPHNVITVDIAPFPVTFETFTPGERFFTVMNHELVHIATTNVTNDEDRGWQDFFHGKPAPITEHPESILYNYLAAPRELGPRWFLEGIAVFQETWMGGGLGRAQGGYDEMVFRAMVRDHAHFYDPLGLEAEAKNVDFQVGADDYLYGTRFMSYLAYTYSPEKVIDWFKRGEDSDRYYATQFERVFGKPLDQVWNDWIEFENRFQQANLSEVQKYPITKVEHLTKTGLGSVSRSFYDPKTDSLIGGFRYPGVLAHIGEISLKDGSVRRLVNIKGPALYRVTSLAFDPALNKLYYTTDNNAYRDLMEIDLASGDVRMLVRDGRVGDLVVNPKDHSIWGIRHLNGLDTLVRLEPGTALWHQIATFPYGHSLFDLDISPDGTLLSASVGEINGDQRIGIYRIDDLMNGTVNEIQKMTLGQSIPEGGVFSEDGRYLYATAYYTGVSNVYRLDVQSGDVEAVSNAVTGFFRPIPMADGSLIVDEYTGRGFVPSRIEPKVLNDLGTIHFLGTEVANKYPVVKSWAVGSPAKVPLDSMITARGEYIPLDELRLDSTYPIVMGYKAHAALGWYFSFEDPLQYDQLWADFSYSPATGLRHGQDYHGEIGFHTLYWHIVYKHNGADFYDLFGPVERSRKGDALLTGYHNVLIYDLPRRLDLSADLDLYSGLDTLPGAQNVHTSARQLASAKLELEFSNYDQSLGAVDYEEGYHLYGALLGDYGKDEFFPKAYAGFDFGYALPWKHASAWLYTAAGFGGGDKTSALRDFYFGAFRNNFVDDRDEKRYREYDSFPGYRIDAIAARSFVKSLAELNLPPVRFEDIGTPGFYLSWARTAFFGGVLFANPGAHDATTDETLGVQVDFNFTVALRLPLTFSVGYAKGFGDGPGRRDELMASLKILYTPAMIQ